MPITISKLSCLLAMFAEVWFSWFIWVTKPNARYVKTRETNKKNPTKTEGNKEKPQILPQLFITCFNLSVVRWKKASWESGTCPPYKIYVTRWGKVRSLHLVAVNVHETPCWRELGNVILFPLSLKFPPFTCGFAQSVPDFRNGASLKAGPGDTHTHTHYNCLFLLLWWPVRAEGSNGAISSAASKGRQMKLIYLIIRRSRMKIFSGTEFLRCKQTSKYDLVCSCRIFFLHSFSYSCSSQFKNTLVSMPESALPAPALHLLSPVAIN